MRATYSPDDNKLRLYPVSRLDAETYAKVKAEGFKWAPKQELFVAPIWTPAREDLLVDLCGEVGDEDTSLTERAEERAERFADYGAARAEDAERAREAVSAIADHIPLGQPILVGHHSEKHARKDAERIENGMWRAVNLWETSQYWTARAQGALRHAKYKERPDVRARRIKGLEADLRKQQKTQKEAETYVALWKLLDDPTWLRRKDGGESTLPERAIYLANHDYISQCFPLADYPRLRPDASPYEGSMSLWSALTDGIIAPEQARDIAVACHRRTIASADRWVAHLENRLTYERAMLEDAGGTIADRTGPEIGGAVRCWASPRGGWSYIQKVNKVSVTVLDNWRNGGANFTRTIPFDQLKGVMTKAEVAAKREAGLLFESENKIGFYLHGESTSPPPAVLMIKEG